MNNLDEKIEKEEVINVISPKEMKKKILPEFQQNPDKYYPVKTLTGIGFSRHHCKKCSKYFWSHELRDICGDSNCIGKYQFIDKKVSKLDNKITYEEAWKNFENSFTNSRIPCTSIKRYPTVARWRNDVDYVAAGIYCFQPYCVTGEMDPPANPLICPQFCLRFNDLDNVGLTGRHYSGFIMNGIQVFNYENDFKFFKEECVEFNFNWLTKGLKIDPKEIIFMEDVWCGGGNLGPCIEYFIGGLELGNMVFMEFKTFHDGSFEELPIKVIDVGIGLERIPWVINGSPCSYFDVFKTPYKYLKDSLNINDNMDIWNKIGPRTCELDVDENENIQNTWKEISEELNKSVDEIKTLISPLRELFILLDHTRSILMLITDGALPSNTGGGSNLRNIIRRTFAIIKKNKWIDILQFEGYLKIFELHKKDLSEIYGNFEEYKSFDNILKIEFERWNQTDESTKKKVLKEFGKKNKKISIEDWYIAVTSWGISADTINEITGLTVPDNLYHYIAEKQGKSAKKSEQILYNTSNLTKTEELFYEDDKLTHFDAKIISIFNNIQNNNIKNILILDRTVFYPTSGGQANDTGSIFINNIEYKVLNAEKVGKCILHILDREVEENVEIGQTIKGNINLERRVQLRNHHTATHIIFASCRKIWGPHVWQNGAKKTINNAHLDITHYSSLKYEDEKLIERTANEIILNNFNISKKYFKKEEAEDKYGFRLYQGGIVPGNKLRVVNIEDTDVEACCGTHCDNTSEVGWIKLIASKRIADGIVRLYFVAGKRTIEKLEEQNEVINKLTNLWGIPQNEINQTAERFFKESKKYKALNLTNIKTILSLQVKYLCNLDLNKMYVIVNDESPSIYFSYLGSYLEAIKKKEKALVYISKKFIYTITSLEEQFNLESINKICEDNKILFDLKSKTKTVNKKKMYEKVFLMKEEFDKKIIIKELESQNYIDFNK